MARALLFLAVLLSCGGESSLESGRRAFETGDLLAAERSFRKALDQDSQSVDALYGLGWVYHLSGSGSRARDYFMRCLRIDSNDYRGYKGLGSLALGEGNFPIAMERLERRWPVRRGTCPFELDGSRPHGRRSVSRGGGSSWAAFREQSFQGGVGSQSR